MQCATDEEGEEEILAGWPKFNGDKAQYALTAMLEQ
jgi:hypothetical protein